MLCETCKNNPATIHTADIVNNVKSEKHVCEACYEKGDMSLHVPTFVEGFVLEGDSID